MRIFDNPNHIHYGPVRCMWIMLAQLDLLDLADNNAVATHLDKHWDEWISWSIDMGFTEQACQRKLLEILLPLT